MTDDFSPITGRCMCGAVEVSAAEPFVGALYCHCTRCQRRSGTTRSALLCPAGAFSVTAGEEKVRIWDPADGWLKAFCADCGSHTHDPNGRPQARGDPSGLPWTTTPASAPRRTSSWPTPPRSSRSPTTGCRASPSGWGPPSRSETQAPDRSPARPPLPSRGQAAVDAAVRRASGEAVLASGPSSGERSR